MGSLLFNWVGREEEEGGEEEEGEGEEEEEGEEIFFI
jgi:hypothetical protein